MNQFRGGFLYNWGGYALGVKTPVVGDVDVGWDLLNYGFMSGDGDAGYTCGRSQRIIRFSTGPITMTWQHGAHTFTFGASWYREQDHYWNPPAGVNCLNLGLVPGDPAFDPSFQCSVHRRGQRATQQAEGEQIYAILDRGRGCFERRGGPDRVRA